MKFKYLSFALLMAMGGFLFSSCEKDDNSTVQESNDTTKEPENPQDSNDKTPQDPTDKLPEGTVQLSTSEIAERLYGTVSKTIKVSDLEKSISEIEENGGTIQISGITNDNVAEVGYLLFDAELSDDLTVVLDGGADFTKIPNNAFNSDAPKTLSKSKWGYDLTFVIPETVKEIGENAFLGFRGKIMFMGEPPTFGKNAFYCWADDQESYIWCDFYVSRQYIEKFKKDHVRVDSYEDNGVTYYESIPYVHGIVDRKVSKTIESADFEALLKTINECDETTITINGINNDNFMVWVDAMDKFVKEDDSREDCICANINLILNSDGKLEAGLGSIFDYISLKSLVLPEGILALDSYCFENFYCDELTIPKSVKESGNTIFGHAGVKNKLIIKTECILELSENYLHSSTLVIYVPQSVIETYKSEYPTLKFEVLAE